LEENKMVIFKNAFILAAAALLVFAGAAGAAPTSGAASFSIVAAPAATNVNGDPVNLTIQVLDANGNINLPSNGQAGDVVFSISSSLGTVIVPAGNSGFAVNGGVGGGSFASVNEVNIMPKEGKILANVAYNGVAGSDTITVRMFNSVVTNANFTVGADQIGAAQTFNVAVAEGTTITRITNVALTNNVDPADADPDATYVDQEEQVAGAPVAFQVTVGAGQSGPVTVDFVGISQSDVFGNSASGTTVSVDVNVQNGTGTGVATFPKAGYYEIRASANSGDVTYTKTAGFALATNIFGGRYALRIRPDVPVSLSVSTTKTVVDASTTGTTSTAGATVTRLDQYGNASGYVDATIATPVAAAPVDVTLAASGTGSLFSPTRLPFWQGLLLLQHYQE
jgi:hypothetical protein